MPISKQTPDEHRLNDREQIQYLLGNPPTWMMRFGLTALSCFFALVIGLSCLVHYPDIVEAKVTLTTTDPPIRVMARTGGRVTGLMAASGQAVAAGQLLAVLENTAAYQDVLRLEAWLDSTGQPGAAPPSDLPFSGPGLQLGDVQAAYSTFSQHLADYRYFSQNTGTGQKIAALRQQIAQLQGINANLLRQQAIMRDEFALAEKGRGRQQQLLASGTISTKEYETTEAAYLQQKRQIESAEAGILQNGMQIKQMQAQITDLGQAQSDGQNDRQLALAEDRKRLHGAIADWKQAFLVTAPIAGTVSLSKIWGQQQPIAAGEEVLAIVPASKGSARPGIIGKATLPIANAGKVRAGMTAIVYLDGLPTAQYGTLETVVGAISLLPQKDEYLLDLFFSDTLRTSYGKTVPFRQEMTGQVRILLEDRRVVGRVFGGLRELLEERP